MQAIIVNLEPLLQRLIQEMQDHANPDTIALQAPQYKSLAHLERTQAILNIKHKVWQIVYLVHLLTIAVRRQN